MNAHEFLRAHLLLKGGTAINLTIFELPRLSVDIDMDFVPNLPREDMLQTRETISGIIKAYMESEGYAFSPASRIHHSLDAFHFTYTNAAGNQDMIKIELNYSLRAHLFEPMTRTFATDAFGTGSTVITVHPMEIFAAKANALLSRSAARDLYDFNQMIDRNMFAEQTDLFRKSIIFYASISQEIISPSFGTDAIDSLTFQKIRRDLFPVLKQEERRQTFDLEGRKEAAKEFIHTLMIPTEEEIEYMNRFSQKEYRPELLFDDPSIIERIAEHPMALWKCK
jgi:predicted nucleotidyltransferase component of viral defense system